jgi:hypothetical protein
MLNDDPLPNVPLFLRLVLSDLAVFAVINGIASGTWDFIDPSVLDAWPTIKDHAAAVRSHPLVVEHGGL